MITINKWPDTEQASRRLAVSTRTIRRLIAQGDLAASRWAGAWRIEPESLDAVLRAAQDPGLDVHAAAAAAGVGIHVIYRALRSGELRGRRDRTGAWRLRAGELDAWLEKATEQVRARLAVAS